MKNSSKRRILFEIFVVVSILVVAIYFIVNVSEKGRVEARNVTRVAQVQEYQKAFNILYSETGRYPFDNKQQPTCLGSYLEKSCWLNQSIPETNLISQAIIPKYMPRLPEGETRKFGQDNGYTGIVYISGKNGKSYKIFYFMEGNDRSCIAEGASGSNSGEDTLCILNFP